MKTFYLGTHRPHWLTISHVPLFISIAQLAKYRTSGDEWPTRKADTFGCGVWALDSGAFTALDTDKRDHPWHLDLDLFGGMVTRIIDEVGAPPTFAAIPDWPCEARITARTGLTVREHCELTVDTYRYLVEEFPHVPWIPVIQGRHVDDYLACERMYLAAGVDLAAVRRVGLGSICRRGSDADIAAVVTTFAGRGYRLHGFGVKTSGLRRIGHLLTSADSMAWSVTARLENIRMPECEASGAHLGPCNNCFRWALVWRERVLAAVRAGDADRAQFEQLALDVFAVAA